MTKNKKTFTLVEVLVVISVIGIVAALTIPAVMTKLTDKIKKNQITVFEKKINQATARLALEGKIGPYYKTTKEFVDELSKVMKTAAVCDPDSGISLDKCWTYKEVKNDDGTSFEVKYSRDGKSAFKVDEDFMEVIGIITGDGTPMLLSFNSKCEILDPDSSYKEGETSDCIAGVYDINGAKGPNKFGKDIVSFNANGFGSSCYFKIGGVCYSGVFAAPRITPDQCLQLKQQGKLKTNKECCTAETISYCQQWGDNWMGAVYKCGGQNNMVSQQELHGLLKELYSGADISTSGWTHNLTVDKDSDAYKYTELTTKYTTVWTRDRCSRTYSCSDWRVQSNQALPYSDNVWDNSSAAICVYK